MRAHRWNRLLTLSLLLVPACAAGPSDRVRVERSDSAGVEIVLNAGGEVPLERRFERSFSIGGVDAGPASFGNIGPNGVAADAASRIYVLDWAAFHVVAFDSAGRHLHSFGRSGGGPGEFRGPAGIAVHPDGRVGVFDFARRAFVWFAPDGAALDIEPVAARFSGGIIRISGSAMHIPERITDRQTGAMVHRLLRIGPADTVALVEGGVLQGRQLLYESCGVSITLPPLFTTDLAWDARDDVAAAVAGARYVIDVYRGAERVRSIRRDVAPMAVTEAMAYAEVGDGEDWSIGGSRCTVPPQEVVEKRGYAAELPAVTAVALTPAGELWARRGSVRGEPVVVDVFSADGEYLGTLPEGAPWPAAFLPDGRLIAIETDELDVQRLVGYRMVGG